MDAGAASTYSARPDWLVGVGLETRAGLFIKEGGSCKSCRSDLPLKNSFPYHQNTGNGSLVTGLFGGKPAPTSRSSAARALWQRVTQISPYPPIREHDHRESAARVRFLSSSKEKTNKNPQIPAPVRALGCLWCPVAGEQLIDIDWSIWPGHRWRHRAPEQLCLKRPPQSMNANRIDLGPISCGGTGGLLLLRRSRESSVFSSPKKSRGSSTQSTVGPPAPRLPDTTSGPRSDQEVEIQISREPPSGLVL